VTIERQHRKRRSFLAEIVLTLLVVCTPGSVFGAEYGADLALASIYTDNLTLAPDEFAKSQWLNAVNPHVFLTQVAPQYSVDFDYRLQALFYAGESELNEAFSQLWTTGMLNLIGQELFLRGFARATQVNIDPEGRQADNNLNITGNRSDALAWEIGPQWQQNLFGARSFVDAAYFVGRIDYDADDVQGVDTQEARVSLESDPVSTRSFSYRLFYRYRNLDYDNTGPAKFQRAGAELGYFVNPFLELAGIAGSESNLAANDGKLDEPYWELGFRSWFGSNSVEAFYGRRFYGLAYRLTWTRTMAASDFRMAYRETQQTDESGAIDDLSVDVRQDIDPAEDRSLTPNSGIDRPGSGNRSLNKRLIADYRARLYRTDLHLFAFWREREELASNTDPGIGPVGSLSTDESVGAGFDLSWLMGAKTTLSLYCDWMNREFDTQAVDAGRPSDMFRGDIRLNYFLGRFTDIRATFGYQKQSGTPAFQETHAALRLTRYFGIRRGAGNRNITPHRVNR
jgi:uncharacterized protein (PEP-CTERM system associated)